MPKQGGNFAELSDLEVHEKMFLVIFKLKNTPD